MYLQKNFNKFVVIEEVAKNILNKIDELVKLPLKTNNGDMKQLLNAAKSTETYQQQASNILFNQEKHVLSEEMNALEIQMRCDSGLTLNRRYIKIVVQALNHIENNNGKFNNFNCILKQGHLKTFNSTVEFTKFLKSDDDLVKEISYGTNKNNSIPTFTLRKKIIDFFHELNGIFKNQDLIYKAKQLKEEIGDILTTGF